MIIVPTSKEVGTPSLVAQKISGLKGGSQVRVSRDPAPSSRSGDIYFPQWPKEFAHECRVMHMLVQFIRTTLLVQRMSACTTILLFQCDLFAKFFC